MVSTLWKSVDIGVDLAESVRVERNGDVLAVQLSRPEKRNALNLDAILGLEAVFTNLPDDIRVAVLEGEGEHFCAGLDLSEVAERGKSGPDPARSIRHSRTWHRVFNAIEKGPVPVISALKGAVIGGGLELAASTHLRVAEKSTFYAMPEASHGIFVGGGASVRVSRLIGVANMTDLMLTGRRYDAEEGREAGLSQYVVDNGSSGEFARELAVKIADNATWSNFAVLQSLPRIAAADPEDGLFFETLTAAFVSMAEGNVERVQSFLEGKR